MVGTGVGRMMGNAAAATATIPVAKVLPQQASAPSQGGPISGPPRPTPHGQVRAQSPAQAPDTQPPHTSVFLHRAHTGRLGICRCTLNWVFAGVL